MTCPTLLAGTLAVRISNNINSELSILHIIPRLGRHRAALLAPVVKQVLEKARRLPSGASGAILIKGADGAGASNLLASIVPAIARLDAVHDGLEIDEVSGRAVRWAEAGATAVDAQGRGGSCEGSNRGDD